MAGALRVVLGILSLIPVGFCGLGLVLGARRFVSVSFARYGVGEPVQLAAMALE